MGACVSQAPLGTVQRGARVLGSGGKLTGTSERIMQPLAVSQIAQAVYQGDVVRPALGDAGPRSRADKCRGPNEKGSAWVGGGPSVIQRPAALVRPCRFQFTSPADRGGSGSAPPWAYCPCRLRSA